MATILFDSLQAADTRSRELWTAILGRAKHEQDVTEYAYSRTVDDETGDIAIVINERDEHLDTLLRMDEMTADEIAALVDLYPLWSADSVQYETGDIVAYDGALYEVVQAHVSQESWTPDATPALWEPCSPEGTIPIWQAPSGAHDAYSIGDRVTHNGQVWESLINGNVWEPGAPGTEALWQVVA